MITTEDISNAKITWGGSVMGGADDSPLPVYCIEIEPHSFWFIGDDQYEADECRFKIEVSSFGLREKIAAGSTGDQFRAKFDESLVEPIRERITKFFMGSEEKPFFPFAHPKAKCIGVDFRPKWILSA